MGVFSHVSSATCLIGHGCGWKEQLSVITQTSVAAMPEQTREPIRLDEAPGYVNNDLMSMRAITVINTAHVKHCQLSKVSRRSCVTLKGLHAMTRGTPATTPPIVHKHA